MLPRRSASCRCINHLSEATQCDFDDLLDDTSYVDLQITEKWLSLGNYSPVSYCYHGMPNSVAVSSSKWLCDLPIWEQFSIKQFSICPCTVIFVLVKTSSCHPPDYRIVSTCELVNLYQAKALYTRETQVSKEHFNPLPGPSAEVPNAQCTSPALAWAPKSAQRMEKTPLPPELANKLYNSNTSNRFIWYMVIWHLGSSKP